MARAFLLWLNGSVAASYSHTYTPANLPDSDDPDDANRSGQGVDPVPDFLAGLGGFAREPRAVSQIVTRVVAAGAETRGLRARDDPNNSMQFELMSGGLLTNDAEIGRRRTVRRTKIL